MNLENCQEKQDNISIRTVPTTEEIIGRFPTLETVEIRGREQFTKCVFVGLGVSLEFFGLK